MRWKVFLSLALYCHNLKVELLNGEQKKITFYAMEKFFFVLGTLLPQPESRTSQWRTKKITLYAMEKIFLALALYFNMKVEISQWRTKKIMFYAMEKFFLALALCRQPESRTSQWRTKKITFYAMEKFFWPWHSFAILNVELLNGEQKKLRSKRWKSFFYGLGTLLPT
jgi:hypothetical protein